MYADHTPLPWKTDRAFVVDKNDLTVADCMAHLMSNTERKANAALIVRAVNALPAFEMALKEIAALARFEQDYPSEMRDTAFSVIEKRANTALEALREP